jgi:hypothetical protein
MGVNDLEILVSWTNNATNPTGFMVQISTDQSNWYSAGIATGAARNFIIRGCGLGGFQFLQEGATYYIRVDAENSNGASFWSNVTSASVVTPGVAIAGGQDMVIICGGNNQPMNYLLQGVIVGPGDVLEGTGNSVGSIWIHDVKEGYNAFLTADPGDGAAPSPGEPPFNVPTNATNDILNNDGSGRIYDEMMYEILNRGIFDIGLIGYSHGGGMIWNISRRLSLDPNKPSLVNVVFCGTIDAVEYGTGADSGPPSIDGWYISDPLPWSPGAANYPNWSAYAVNYYENNGWYCAYDGYGYYLPIHGISLPGSTFNYLVNADDHSSIALDLYVLTGVENATDEVFFSLSYIS